MLVHGVDISTLEGWMVKINSNPSMFGKSTNRRWFRVALLPAGTDQKLVLSYAKTKYDLTNVALVKLKLTTRLPLRTAKEPRGWLYLEDVSGVYCRRVRDHSQVLNGGGESVRSPLTATCRT